MCTSQGPSPLTLSIHLEAKRVSNKELLGQDYWLAVWCEVDLIEAE
jgi:hypothetical protein